MKRLESDGETGNELRTMFIFSSLALFHSYWTGWLAPLGILLIGTVAVKSQVSASVVVGSQILALAAGMSVGFADVVLLKTIPSLGTGNLILTAMGCLAEAVYLSDRSMRWRFGAMGLFIFAWSLTFLLLTALGFRAI